MEDLEAALMCTTVKYHPLSDFLTNDANKPLNGFCGSIYLGFLLLLFITWLGINFKTNNSNRGPNNIRALYYKQTVFCCVVLVLLNLCLCLLNIFYWYRNGRNNENIIISRDSLLGTFVWLFVSVYLHTHVSNFKESTYPFVLRVWWVSFSSISCFSLFLHYVHYKHNRHLAAQFLVFEVLSTFVSLFLCYVGFFDNNEYETITPSTTSSIFSLLTFSWIDPLIAIGYKKPLDLEDIPQLDDVNSARGAFSVIKSRLESEKRENIQITTFSLAKAVVWTTWTDIIITALLALVYTLSTYVGPFLIDAFVEYVNGHRDLKEGFFLVSAFFFSKIVECLANRHQDFKQKQAGIKARGALIATIYQKGLTLSSRSKQGRSSGEIINFVAVDAERVGDFSHYMHNPWLVILEVGLALAILYKNLGVSSLAAFVATIIVVLVNIPLRRFQKKFEEKLMKYKDKRMKTTSEILKNMRILKLHGWEMKFLSRIHDIRKDEARWLYKIVYSMAMTNFSFWVAPTFVTIATFGTCILAGIQLDSGKVFSALATFKVLQESAYTFPQTVSMIIQTKVSLDRIASFLRLEDLDSDMVENVPRDTSDNAIEIINGNFSWDVTSSNPTLIDINFRVAHGMRVAVCGVVGSGKSSLLSCILGEVPKLAGHVRLSGTRAYVGQSPWIQSGKIEENILFGKEMDRGRYDRVLEACALKSDLEVLPFGDQTIIGERGINLSGGQKQRIQIARALYQDADIYLFDDPFSAVDAHTGSHIFKECMMSFLESKTVIYVTHQVEFLHDADLILVLKDGRLAQVGKYDDILKSGSNFIELVGAHKDALLEITSLGNKLKNVNENKETQGTFKKHIQEKTIVNIQNGKNRQLVVEEEREKGKIHLSVYRKYLTIAYGGALVPLVLLAQITFESLQILGNYWMAWASSVSDSIESRVGGSKLIIVYMGFGVGCAFCALARSMLVMKAGYETANQLFYKMHFCIFRAPMSFFDSNPSGRILNRASTDQGAVDVKLPDTMILFAAVVIQLFGVVIVMSLGAWLVFFFFVLMTGICIGLQRYYIPSARELARLVGVSKAPVIQHFSETISGSTTIRSFDQINRFRDTCLNLIDNYSRPSLHVVGALDWLTLRLDMLSSLMFAFTLIFLVLIPEGTIDPSIAGLAVTYGLYLNKLQGWTMEKLCNVEIRFISAERIFQYCSIPSEPPLIIDSNTPNCCWPSNGKVDIVNLQVRYAPHMPLVVKGITCTFHGGTKTGIVGRTGSGKSTLIQTLFRIVEPAGGKIVIDGINISSIGLHDLRSRLSIIPQDPTMFNGTLRTNMDPLEEYTDDQIWEALDKCQMGDEVRKKEGQLDSTVTENGENWSMGQRQLVCLGRVLLKKSKILVLDEATASVDTSTDNMIQKTIRIHFLDSTVITIAHRITSVINNDMVLVLTNGSCGISLGRLIEEYDSPKNLLEEKLSSFSKLVAEYSLRSSSSHTISHRT
ncbi:hypothetical protein LXL04_016171 [Taraxacum kok-saghyz]